MSNTSKHPHNAHLLQMGVFPLGEQTADGAVSGEGGGAGCAKIERSLSTGIERTRSCGVQGAGRWAGIAELKRQLTVVNLDSVFKKYDKDNNGYLDVEELGQAMEDMNMRVPQPELEAFFRRMDTDKDDKVSRQEFELIIKKKGFQKKLAAHIRAFISFIAMVGFWYAVYDGFGNIPLELLIERFVDEVGLNQAEGEGFERARFVEVLYGSTLVILSGALLVASNGFMYSTGGQEEEGRGQEEDIEVCFRAWCVFTCCAFEVRLNRWFMANYQGILMVCLWAGVDLVYGSIMTILSQNFNLIPRVVTCIGFWAFANVVLVATHTINNLMSRRFADDEEPRSSIQSFQTSDASKHQRPSLQAPPSFQSFRSERDGYVTPPEEFSEHESSASSALLPKHDVYGVK